MAGLSALLAEQGGSEDLLKAADEIEAMPGGSELLYTMAAQDMMKSQGIPTSKAKKLRLFDMGNGETPPMKKAKGGLAAVAEKTRKGGRGDDEVLLHMSPEEFEAIEAMWGKAETNPDTGLPEYGFLSKIWKKVKSAVKKVTKSKLFQMIAPIALNFFVPGLGVAIGGALGATGAAAAVAGQAVIGAGFGAVSGGTKGALAGAISGGVTGGAGKMAGAKLGLSGKTADVVGSSLLTGAGSSALGGDFTEGAISGGLSAIARPKMDKIADDLRTDLGYETGNGMFMQKAGSDLPLHATPGVTPGMSPDMMGAGTVPGKLGLGELAAKYALPAMTAMSAVSGAGGQGEAPGALGDPEGFGDPLPNYQLNRQVQKPMDYFTYGQAGSANQGEFDFFKNNTLPSEEAGGIQMLRDEYGNEDPGFNPGGIRGQLVDELKRKQSGGEYRFNRGGQAEADGTGIESMFNRATGHHVRGQGSGRSDEIDAKLSDGEYVIDAESVALLGDGSGDEGARKLDILRKNLRQHKGKNLKAGKFSHKAKSAEGYLPKAKKRRKPRSSGMESLRKRVA